MQKVAQSTLARRKRVFLTALLIGALCNQVLAAEPWAEWKRMTGVITGGPT